MCILELILKKLSEIRERELLRGITQCKTAIKQSFMVCPLIHVSIRARKVMFKGVVESVSLYRVELRKLTEFMRMKLKGMEMMLWRRSWKLSLKEYSFKQ